MAVALLLEEVAEIKKILKAKGTPGRPARASASSSVLESSSGEVDMDKVCEILGKTKQTVYGLLRSGKLKARKQGRKQLFLVEDVVKYANTPKKKTRKSKKAN